MIIHKKNSTEVHLGSGDIIMYPVYWHDGVHTGICFEQDSEQREIGKYVKGSGEKFDIENQDVIMTFSDIRSIDVLVEELQEIRDYMLLLGLDGDSDV